MVAKGEDYKNTKISMRTFAIYRILLPNGKSFIGKTNRGVRRVVEEHLTKSFLSRLSIALRNCEGKYKVVVLEMGIRGLELATSKEAGWIAHFNTSSLQHGYNSKRAA